MSLGAILGVMGDGRERGGLLASIPSLTGSLPTTTTNQDQLVAILKSRKMKEGVLGELAKTWGPSVPSMVTAVDTNVAERGIIGLTVEASHPQLAADVANHFFIQLDRVLQERAEATARHEEAFYKNQLERAAGEVHLAEQALLKFQAENRFLASSMDQTGTRGAGGDPTVSLRASIMALELQREVLRMRVTDQHPQMRELERQIAELKRQYSKTLFGGAMELPPESPVARGARREFFVSAEKMTPVQLAFLKHVRSLKIQEAFYTAALQGLEQLKYGNGSRSPRIDFLDVATPPLGPSRPKPLILSLVAASSAAVAGVFLAFFLEYLRVARADQRRLEPPSARRSRAGEGEGEPTGIPSRERLRTVETAGTPAPSRRP